MLLIIASARPQLGNTQFKRKSEGIDIMLVIDTSGSMKALDFSYNNERKNRLYVVKKVVSEFVKERLDDRIGLVVFGDNAYIQSPLTLDHQVLDKYIDRMEIGMAGNSTAIGDAMATTLKRLVDIESKSKVAILLTDGENTAGTIDPKEATEAAKSLGVKFYTIAIGRSGSVPIPVDGLFGKTVRKVRMNVDTKLLKYIASETGGEFFQATDTESLVKIYDSIDQLEKTEIEKTEFKNYKDIGEYFLFAALIVLLLEVFVGFLPWRAIP